VRQDVLQRLGLVRAIIPAEVASIADKRMAAAITMVAGQVSARIPVEKQLQTIARDAYIQGWMDALVNTGHFDK